MKNNIMETINTVYKNTQTLEEQEILKLDSLLTRVGGDAQSILLKAEDTSMADFINTCIRNGITFELRNDNSEVAPTSNDKPSAIQSPSDEDNSCEKCCTEAEKRLTRITLENWKELLSIGDKVVIIDDKGNRTTDMVTAMEVGEYGGRHFMELDEHWVYFEDDNICDEGRKYYVER